jgi:hypothetical protein
MPRKTSLSRIKQQTCTHTIPQVKTEKSIGIPSWLPELEKWEKSEYDGIKGSPPQYIPEPHIEQFRLERNRLFFLAEEKKVPYAEIRSRFDFLLQNKYGALVLAHLQDNTPYDAALLYLVRLYRLVLNDNPEECVRQLGGTVAVAGFRVRTGHKKRATYSAKETANEIARAAWLENSRLTIKDIINLPEVANLPGTDKTKREWLSKIDPRPSSSKQGRPRQSK